MFSVTINLQSKDEKICEVKVDLKKLVNCFSQCSGTSINFNMLDTMDPLLELMKVIVKSSTFWKLALVKYFGKFSATLKSMNLVFITLYKMAGKQEEGVIEEYLRIDTPKKIFTLIQQLKKQGADKEKRIVSHLYTFMAKITSKGFKCSENFKSKILFSDIDDCIEPLMLDRYCDDLLFTLMFKHLLKGTDNRRKQPICANILPALKFSYVGNNSLNKTIPKKETDLRLASVVIASLIHLENKELLQFYSKDLSEDSIIYYRDHFTLHKWADFAKLETEYRLELPPWVTKVDLLDEFIPYNLYRIKNLLVSIPEVKALGIEIKTFAIVNNIIELVLPLVFENQLSLTTIHFVPTKILIETLQFPKSHRARSHFHYYLGKIVRFLLWQILKSKIRYHFICATIINKVKFIFWLLIYVHLTKKRPPQVGLFCLDVLNQKRPPKK
jgi:hypothetical protein